MLIVVDVVLVSMSVGMGQSCGMPFDKSVILAAYTLNADWSAPSMAVKSMKSMSPRSHADRRTDATVIAIVLYIWQSFMLTKFSG